MLATLLTLGLLAGVTETKPNILRTLTETGQGNLITMSAAVEPPVYFRFRASGPMTPAKVLRLEHVLAYELAPEPKRLEQYERPAGTRVKRIGLEEGLSYTISLAERYEPPAVARRYRDLIAAIRAELGEVWFWDVGDVDKDLVIYCLGRNAQGEWIGIRIVAVRS